MSGNSRPDYVRASKLRKRVAAGKELPEDDAAWFESYEQAKKPVGRPSPVINASASEKITYTEERSAAQGDHPHPAAYESMVRAEGLRADTLLRISADALVRCNEQYATMMAHLLARTTAIETAHVAMLEAVREQFVARMEAEADAIQMQGMLEASGEGSELAQLISYVMQAKAQKDAHERTPEGRREKMARMRAAKKSKASDRKAGRPLGDPS
jgi:hypothetical protein